MEDFDDRKYVLYIDDQEVARYLSLEMAQVFIEAIFKKYYNDRHMKVTIREELLCCLDEVESESLSKLNTEEF